MTCLDFVVQYSVARHPYSSSLQLNFLSILNPDTSVLLFAFGSQMNNEFEVRGSWKLLRMLWLVLEEAVMAQISCKDGSALEFLKLQKCRTTLGVRTNL